MRMRTYFPPFGPIIALGVVLVMIAVPKSAPLAPQVPPGVASETGPSDEKAEELELPLVSDYKSAIKLFGARPLFVEGRHMPEPLPSSESMQVQAEPMPETAPEVPVEAPKVADPPPDPPAIHMLGSMGMGAGYRALIRDDTDGSERWVATGAEIGRWTLVEIAQSSIRLRAGDHEIAIQLFE